VGKPWNPKHRFGKWRCIEIFFLHCNGTPVSEIAAKYEISESYLYKLSQRGRDYAATSRIPPDNEIIFRPERTMKGKPVGQCPHGKPIQVGDAEVCLECMEFGLDYLDKLQKSKEPPKKTHKFQPKQPKTKAKTVVSPKDWSVDLPSGKRLLVSARTKSEALAEAKKLLGVDAKESLPDGTSCNRLTDQPKSLKTKRKIK
jgi:hypothetical protein